VRAEDLAWRVERACFEAWPDLDRRRCGDWIVRAGAGVSRRNNSANPLRPDPKGLEAAIAAAEQAYGDWGLPPTFRIPSFLDPAIDARLEQLGYRLEGETLTLHGPCKGMARQADPEVEMQEAPGDDWLQARALLSGYTPEQMETVRRVLARLDLPAAFATLRRDGRILSLAYGAASDGLFCVEAVVTAHEARRRGLGRRMLMALLASPVARDCEGVCLQVQADNWPALPLYRSLGIDRELYRYHYRRKPPPV
jgi:ribosomal protein S18 acetylase RimI-like enzyme